jgi:hypothetical protein
MVDLKKIDDVKNDSKENKVSKALLAAKPNFLKTWQFALMLVLLLAALGAAGYFWNESRTAKSQTVESIAAKNAEESSEVINELNKVLLTESDAEPTVARVDNPDVLRNANKDFYKNVQAGDYLILYPQRAIIFRVEEKRVINVAPIIDTTQVDTKTKKN